MISSLESYSSCIKQEISTEMSFTDKFIHIMEKVQQEHNITKDLVLELIQLFYQNNTLFLHLFQSSFLLIFNTYANEGARFNKYESQQIIDKYSGLLKSFLIQMINMELQVKKTIEEQQYFQNFVDFYLAFFAQALISPKFFIKDFAFNILVISFKIIDEVLDVELLPQTENQLTQSCIYLLGSNFEDYKKMGVKLYGILKKIKITSIQVQELLFWIIERESNFSLRRLTILEGISINTQEKINRFLNRLKDKNPFIISTVIEKLVNQKLKFQNLNYKQRAKILINGIKSHHAAVRQMSLQFVGFSVIRFIAFNKIKLESEQNQTDESGIQRFFRLFNSDHLSPQKEHSFQQNHFILQVALKSISIFSINISPKLLKAQIKGLFFKIEQLEISQIQSKFVYQMLKQMCINQNQSQERNGVDDRKKQLRKFINQADFLPSFGVIIQKIATKLVDKQPCKQIETFGVSLRIIQILISNFDITDQGGKRVIVDQLRKFITGFECKDVRFDTKNKKNEKNKQNHNSQTMGFLALQLRKFNNLLSKDSDLAMVKFPVTNNHLDLLSLAVQVFLNLSRQQIKDSILQLRIQINELVDTKQLRLQNQINSKMLFNISNQIFKAQSGKQDSKPIQNLLEIKSQLQKRLYQSKMRQNSNTVKAFTILARVLSFQQRNNQQGNHAYNNIKASQYFQCIKNYLYNSEDQAVSSYKCDKYYSLSNSYLPYFLIYNYCLQSVQNYKSFQKLFYYYALEQDQTVLKENSKSMLSKLINLRLLTQLQLRYQQQLTLLKSNDINQNQIPTFLSTLLLKHIPFHYNSIHTQLQQSLHQQILIKILTHSFKNSQNKQLLTSLIFTAISNYFDKQNDNLSIHQILLTFQKLSTQQSIPVFQSILAVYQCLVTLFYQKQQPTEISKNNSFLKQITQFFYTLFKIACQNITKYQNYSIQTFNQSLIRLPKVLKIIQKVIEKAQFFDNIVVLRLNNIFSSLLKNTNNIQKVFSQKQLKSDLIKIQLLVFTKKKVQQFLEFCKVQFNLSKLQNPKQSKQYALFLSDIEQIDQKLEQEISKCLGQKNNRYDQQSTQNSPHQESQNNQSNRLKIDLILIQLYNQGFYQDVKRQDKQNKRLINYIQKTHIFTSLITQWKKDNFQQAIQSVQTKVQISQDIRDDENSQEVIQNQNQEIETIFEKRERRQINTSSKKIKDDLYQAKASIKKNRFLIIPYQVVQKAEFSSKKVKDYRKSLKIRKPHPQKSQLSAIYPKIQNEEIAKKEIQKD